MIGAYDIDLHCALPIVGDDWSEAEEIFMAKLLCHLLSDQLLMDDGAHHKMAQHQGNSGSRVRSPHREQYGPESGASHDTQRSTPVVTVSTFEDVIARRFQTKDAPSFRAQIHHRDVCMDEVVAFEKERLSRRDRERVREAVAVVQAGAMPSLSEAAERAARNFAVFRHE
jgi:hypothetical protein